MQKQKKEQKRPPVHSLHDIFFERYPVHRAVLSNGLTVLTIENHELPIASMYTFYNVGSRNERPGITGISHLFEHMMFNGSRKFGPGEFDRILESGGGHSNAYTSQDRTVYYEDFASDLLETVIELDADRMGWLNLSAENLKSEREVVKEERRLRTENSNYGRLEEELYAASFLCHPYRWPVIGWMSDIMNISLKDCREFYRTYYVPKNALIVLAGAFHTSKTLDLLEKYYGRIPSGKTPSPPVTKEPPQQSEKRIQFRKKAQLHNFAVGYHVPGIGHQDIFILDVLQSILTDGESSVLYKIMVIKKSIALYVHCNYSWNVDPGLFEFIVQMKQGHTSFEGEKCMEEEIHKLACKALKKKDLDRAKTILEVDFYHGLQTNNGRAHRIGLSELLFGDYYKMFEPLGAYNRVTENDIHRIIDTYFVPGNKTFVWLDIE